DGVYGRKPRRIRPPLVYNPLRNQALWSWDASGGLDSPQSQGSAQRNGAIQDGAKRNFGGPPGRRASSDGLPRPLSGHCCAGFRATEEGIGTASCSVSDILRESNLDRRLE